MEETQKNNKNLLIISLHADPAMPPGVSEWGGTHTYMRELLTELYEENFNVILLTRKVYEKQDDFEKVSSSCEIVRLTLGTFGDFDKRELFELHELTLQKSVLTLKELNFRPDIIHSVYWNSGHLALKLSKMWGIPYVHSVISNGRGRNAHGAKGTANKRIETEEKVFENASFILCVAESEKNELCQLYGIQPEKIVVAGQYVHPAFIHASHNPYGFPRKSGIHYKIEPIYFPDLKPAKSKTSDWWNSKVFVYTGRLSLDKGLSYIVQAWYLLYQKYGELCPALWIIGGSTCDIENIRSLLGISEDVLCEAENSGKLVWWGYLDENGISALYTRALVLITHSLYEPGGRVAVEAMCEGLPVLATPNGFALDSVQDWKNGFLISYADTKTLAVRMEHFIKQPYLSDIMGRQAKKISHVILRNWDFIGSHLAVYHAALLHRKDISKKKYCYPFNASIQRKLCLYPYNQVLIDKTDILQIAEENQIEHILSIEKLEIPDCSSEIWEIQTQTSEYYVKIPYDRINLFALWSRPKEQPLVIPASKRYAAEIGALKFHGIPPVVGKKDSLYALIRKKYISVKLPTEQFGWQNYFRDYSLRTELLRWKAYYHELPPVIRESIAQIIEPSYSTIWKISSEENNLHFVMNHGGFDMKNLVFTPDIILLDNEKLHPGWPGIDFADMLITYVRFLETIETCELWDTLFRKIPSDIISTNLLAGWVILGTYKEAISMAACLKPVPRLLQERIEILLHFIK